MAQKARFARVMEESFGPLAISDPLKSRLSTLLSSPTRNSDRSPKPDGGPPPGVPGCSLPREECNPKPRPATDGPTGKPAGPATHPPGSRPATNPSPRPLPPPNQDPLSALAQAREGRTAKRKVRRPAVGSSVQP